MDGDHARAGRFVLGAAYAPDMWLRLMSAVAITALTVGAGYLESGATSASGSGVVAAVYDGDTLTLRDGRRIRLVQIDTPELGTGEC
jgi:endonuclease YncB( thermonuclease family)